VIRAMIDRTKLSRSYGVRLVGLYGVIGIGKTTACKALCNDLFTEFQGRVCHVELENGSEIELLKEVLKRLTNTRPKVVDGFNLNEV
jgi:Ni2+-binding GTPase involved in maturation of urease and hydrogenase